MLPVHPLDRLDRLGTRLRRADLDADVNRQTVCLSHHADVDLAFTNPWHLAPHHRRGGRPILAEGLDEQRDQLLEVIRPSGHARTVLPDSDNECRSLGTLESPAFPLPIRVETGPLADLLGQPQHVVLAEHQVIVDVADTPQRMLIRQFPAAQAVLVTVGQSVNSLRGFPPAVLPPLPVIQLCLHDQPAACAMRVSPRLPLV